MSQQSREEILDNFVSFMSKKRVQPSTKYIYEKSAQKILNEINDLTSLEDYNNFLVEHIIKKRSNHFYYVVKMFIKFYINENSQKNRMINALVRPRNNTPKRHRQYMKFKDRKTIIENLKSYKHRVMAKIQFYTGARIGEVLRLKKGDISYEDVYDDKLGKEVLAMVLMITQKGGQKKPIWVMNKGLQDDIDDYTLLESTDYKYYFIDRNERYHGKDDIVKINTNYHWYWEDLKNTLAKFGFSYKDWSTHDFRRDIAHDIWTATKDPISVKRMLRHSRMDTTLRYLNNSGLQTRDLARNISNAYDQKK